MYKNKNIIKQTHITNKNEHWAADANGVKADKTMKFYRVNIV